eukprot:10894583-Lingulodinium_polyedra.AAC.1
MALLLEPSLWPAAPLREFALLDESYGELVNRAVDVGLEEWMPTEELLHLGGRPVVGGGFAVPKPGAPGEDRWINPSKTLN